MTARLVTDLPEPDSPTMTKVSPRSMAKERSSTAVTGPSSVWECHREVLDLEQGAGHVRRLGSNWSRSASPMRLKPSTTQKMASPGKVAIHQAVRK